MKSKDVLSKARIVWQMASLFCGGREIALKRLLYHIVFCLLIIPCFSQNLSVTNLRCESTQNPLGVDLTNPRLSWELRSNQRNVLQTGYRILVADDSSMLKRE